MSRERQNLGTTAKSIAGTAQLLSSSAPSSSILKSAATVTADSKPLASCQPAADSDETIASLISPRLIPTVSNEPQIDDKVMFQLDDDNDKKLGSSAGK